MPLFSADFIFDGQQFLPPETIVESDDNGTILSVGRRSDDREVIFCDGLLMPGMINAHCHLELSYMKGLIAEKKGLVEFLLSVLSLRQKQFTVDEKQVAISQAEAEMLRNGIVAVGDISNTGDTLPQKALQNLYYHTFVECLGLQPQQAKSIVEKACVLRDAFAPFGNSSLVLHAPYSVSPELIETIDKENSGALASIHNQESAAENELFLSRTGDFLRLFTAIQFPPSQFPLHQQSSLRAYLPHLSRQHNILLVHNTYTAESDIQWAQTRQKELYWCLCPNANLYIENHLPDIEMMIRNHCTLVLGTDSLASNHSLSIWHEMETIRKAYRSIPLEEMLRWATANGAKALGIDDRLGSLSPGTKPGIIQIRYFDPYQPVSTHPVEIKRWF